jgi:hypothetical protein
VVIEISPAMKNAKSTRAVGRKTVRQSKKKSLRRPLTEYLDAFAGLVKPCHQRSNRNFT